MLVPSRFDCFKHPLSQRSSARNVMKMRMIHRRWFLSAPLRCTGTGWDARVMKKSRGRRSALATLHSTRHARTMVFRGTGVGVVLFAFLLER